MGSKVLLLNTVCLAMFVTSVLSRTTTSGTEANNTVAPTAPSDKNVTQATQVTKKPCTGLLCDTVLGTLRLEYAALIGMGVLVFLLLLTTIIIICTVGSKRK